MNWKTLVVLTASVGLALAQDVDTRALEQTLKRLEFRADKTSLGNPDLDLQRLKLLYGSQPQHSLEELAFLGQPFFQAGDSGRDGRAYQRGVQALDKNQYEDAVHNFDSEISAKGSRADGAYYWKAYAQNRLGHSTEALATLAELHRQFGGSRWLDDAKALEVEIRAKQGKPVGPGDESSDELKLIALNALMQSDPNRATPVLRKVLNSNQSPAIKEQALFVLSQSSSPDARQVLADLARGGNPDLQAKAIRYLGMMGDDWSRGQLVAIYRSTGELHVKQEILQGFLMSNAKDKLLELARSEKDPGLQKQAIRTLAQTGAKEELWNLYKSEQNTNLRREIVQSMLLDGDSAHLLEIARMDHDPEIRKQAINTLALTGWGKDNGEMANLYRTESDPSLKRALINGMFLQGNAKGLIDLARQEKDPELKRQIISQLALIHSKEATDYMMEILK